MIRSFSVFKTLCRDKIIEERLLGHISVAARYVSFSINTSKPPFIPFPPSAAYRPPVCIRTLTRLFSRRARQQTRLGCVRVCTISAALSGKILWAAAGIWDPAMGWSSGSWALQCTCSLHDRSLPQFGSVADHYYQTLLLHKAASGRATGTGRHGHGGDAYEFFLLQWVMFYSIAKNTFILLKEKIGIWNKFEIIKRQLLIKAVTNHTLWLFFEFLLFPRCAFFTSSSGIQKKYWRPCAYKVYHAPMVSG